MGLAAMSQKTSEKRELVSDLELLAVGFEWRQVSMQWRSRGAGRDIVVQVMFVG